MNSLLEHIIRNTLFESKKPKYVLKSASVKDFNNAKQIGAEFAFMIKSKNTESSRPGYYKNKPFPQFTWVQNDVVKFLQKHYNSYPSIKKYATDDYIFLMGNIAEAAKKNKILFWIISKKTLFSNSKFRDDEDQVIFDTDPDYFFDETMVHGNFARIGDAEVMRWAQYNLHFIPSKKWGMINKGIETPIGKKVIDPNVSIEYPYKTTTGDVYELPNDKMVYKLSQPESSDDVIFWEYMSKDIFEIGNIWNTKISQTLSPLDKSHQTRINQLNAVSPKKAFI